MTEEAGRAESPAILADLVDRQYKASVIPMWGNLGAGSILLTANAYHVSLAEGAAWMCLLLMVMALRLAVNNAYRMARSRDRIDSAWARRWANRSMAVVLVNGFVWAAAAPVVADNYDPIALVVSITTYQGMVMGAVLTMAVHLPSFFAYALPSGLSLVLALGTQGQSGLLALAACNLIGLVLVSVVAVVTGRSF
ncbi:MAG: hypothetical protein RLY86_3910, partial [Pseudomonadota bacterium]